MVQREWSLQDEEAMREGKAIDFMEGVRFPAEYCRGVPLDNLSPTHSQKELLELIHPMRQGLSIRDAAKRLGVTERTLYRRLNDLQERCPNLYREYTRWPTKLQVDVYKLLHPAFGNLSIEDAAKILGVGVTAIYKAVERMKQTHPKAFIVYETDTIKRPPKRSIFKYIRQATFKNPVVVEYIPARHDTQIREKF